ncbi:MAG: hypothetical protein JWN14_741 [Chthonomonadales bacterium]|nr:hypothetical protein [Chthonomonadales bacterium]
MAEKVPTLSVEDWLATIEYEYLADYIRSGGSSVKVLSGTDAQLKRAVARIQAVASSADYFTAHLDPALPDVAGKRPDLHRIDRFFFKVTEEVDWKAWAAMQARQYLESRGIHLEEGRALGDLEQIALDNGRDPLDLLNQYQRELAMLQIRDPRLSIEFRTAITALGRALLIPDAVSPTSEEVLLGWFAGQSMPGAASALKKVQIYERINLANARPMLASFCHWLPQTGHAGLVVTLDFRPYEFKKIAKGKRQAEQLQKVREAIARGANAEELAQLAEEHDSAEPELFYSDAAYMQMLTLIRRFIDEIDRFERFFLVILTSPNFYKDKTLDPTVKRCYFDYDALQTRIGQEVHDTRYANPAASLVQLGGAE